MTFRCVHWFLVLIGILLASHAAFAQTVTNSAPALAVPPTPSPTPPPTPFATGGTLHVLAPTGHFPDWLKTSLEQKLQTKIDIQIYATPEEAQAALAAANAHFDLALVVDRIIAPLIKAKTLRPLPVTQGPRPDHVYMGHYFDIDNRFVLPYAWSLKNGSIITLYHLALPASGANPSVADSAVALFMDPANTARLASEQVLAVTQKEALALVPPAQAHDPHLYPPMSVMNRGVFAKP